MSPTHLILFVLLSAFVTSSLNYQNCRTTFSSINGSLCIRDDFTRTFNTITSNQACSLLCNKDQRCQAFTTNDGPCQLFVFDKCSKSVKVCSCSRRGQVFVKQQPRLQPGALCPPGYGDDLCGVKYKVLSTGEWSVQKERCEAESGLVIMSDVTDITEMNHIDTKIYTKYSATLFLGGYQIPGSAEPAGGWYWVACNISVDNSFWAAGQPNNNRGHGENVTARTDTRPMLTDWSDVDYSYHGVCECLSPFD